MPDFKPWKAPGLAFIVGLVVASGFVASLSTLPPEAGPSKMDWILVLVAPGVVLSLPILLLAGGPHGDYARAWVFLIVPFNGIAYMLVLLYFRWIIRWSKKDRKKA